MGGAVSATRAAELRAAPADASDIADVAQGAAAIAELRALAEASGTAVVPFAAAIAELPALEAAQAEVAHLRAALAAADDDQQAAAVALLLPPSVPDPWGARSADEQWSLLVADELPIVALDAGADAATAASAAAAAPMPSGGGAGGGDAAIYLKAESCDLEGSFDLRAGALAARVVALDLAQNDIEALLLPAPRCWLRLLSLAGNPLRGGLPDLVCCGASLLSLDLSFVEAEGWCWRAAAFAPLACLRRLVLEGCGLTSLLEGGEGGGGGDGLAAAAVPRPLLAGVAGSLRVLSLSDNELAWDAAALAAGLAPLAAGRGGCLEELDLRENDALTEEVGYKEYRACVLGALPALKVLDNKALRTEGGGGRAHLHGLQARMAESDEHFASQEDKSSCSCLEGNACVVKTCCRDWPNRFEVAARVRDEYAKFKQVHDPVG